MIDLKLLALVKTNLRKMELLCKTMQSELLIPGTKPVDCASFVFGASVAMMKQIEEYYKEIPDDEETH